MSAPIPRDQNRYFRLLDLLIEQTTYGNIVWEEIGPWLYRYSGSHSHVILDSRDDDGDFPLRIGFYLDGEETGEVYVTNENSEPSEIAWDSRVRQLWQLVAPERRDPVLSLIEDLERLPPF